MKLLPLSCLVRNAEYPTTTNPEETREETDDLTNITLFIAAFIGIWQLVFMLEIWPKGIIAFSSYGSESFSSLLQDFTLVKSIGMTMYRFYGFNIYHYWYSNRISYGKVSRVRKNNEFLCCRIAILSKCSVGAFCNITNQALIISDIIL